jgi:hypothetical protein
MKSVVVTQFLVYMLQYMQVATVHVLQKDEIPFVCSAGCLVTICWEVEASCAWACSIPFLLVLCLGVLVLRFFYCFVLAVLVLRSRVLVISLAGAKLFKRDQLFNHDPSTAPIAPLARAFPLAGRFPQLTLQLSSTPFFGTTTVCVARGSMKLELDVVIT